MKAGDIYYYAAARATGPNDEGPPRVMLDTYVLRSIRKGIAHLTQKNEFTWVRRGVGKNATWGWASSVPSHCRRSFPLAEAAGLGFGRSPSGAVRLAVRRAHRLREFWSGKCDLSHAQTEAELACLLRWLARCKPASVDGRRMAETADRGSVRSTTSAVPSEETGDAQTLSSHPSTGAGQ